MPPAAHRYIKDAELRRQLYQLMQQRQLYKQHEEQQAAEQRRKEQQALAPQAQVGARAGWFERV
jgi:hypothetical protein